MLGLRAEPCPDMAFALGRLDRPRPAEVPVVWIARRERERRHDLPSPADLTPGVEARDWPTAREQRRGEAGWALRADIAVLHRLTGAMGRSAGMDRALLRAARSRHSALARRRMALATEILARGRAVITDRFHGHVLATLMGIPNVLLDNSYGKNRAVFESWSRALPGVEFADDPAEAQERALALAGPASMSA